MLRDERRKQNGGHTPREAAYDIAIGWLYHAYKQKTDDILDYAKEDSARYKAIKKQVAKLHNRLLQKSGLDGLEIDEEELK